MPKDKEKELDQRVVVIKTCLIFQKEFQTRIRFNTTPEDYTYKDSAEDNNTNDEEHDNRLLAEALFKIDGMQEVFINGHVITVSISAAFSWRELQVRVLESIKSYLRTKILEKKMGEQ